MKAIKVLKKFRPDHNQQLSVAESEKIKIIKIIEGIAQNVIKITERIALTSNDHQRKN